MSRRLLVAILALWLGAGLAAQEPPQRPSALLPLLNARVPLAGVLSGGQPTEEQIALAARAGFRTVINLRTDQESGFEWEREAVEKSGMRYIRIPVAGASGLTHGNAERLDRELEQALESGPVLLHCASGNRIGALLALRAAWLEGVDPEKALQYGRESGLTGLEEATKELLALAPATAAQPTPAPSPTPR
jgi:uncharacterized protein (TIGR01244 family)